MWVGRCSSKYWPTAYCRTLLGMITSTKLWIYENQVVSRITWEFIIYCFPITFVESLQTTANRYLKKWAGLARCANPSILYRRREKKGLQMKALTTHLKCMQLVKYHILKYSVDEETNYVYWHMLSRLKGKKNWNGAKELEERERASPVLQRVMQRATR